MSFNDLSCLTKLGLDTNQVVNRKNTTKYDVYIGRPSKWGNPVYLNDRLSRTQRLDVLIKYCQYLLTREDLLDCIDLEVKDKIIGCYCSPMLCHGHVLNIISKSTNKKQTIYDIIDSLLLEQQGKT